MVELLLEEALSLEYGHKTLAMAVVGIAEGVGSLQQRLANAYCGYLHKLKTEDFPPELQKEFAAIQEAFGRVEDPVRGSAEASMLALSDEEAMTLVKALTELLFNNRQHCYRSHLKDPDRVVLF